MPLTIRTTGIEDYLDGGGANVKALILGPPSAGKTRSASFWPKPIFADCEAGRMSIADRNVPYAEVQSSEDMKALLRMLKVECGRPEGSRRFQTFVVDTLDAYQRIVVQERLRAEKKEALSGFADWGYLDAKMTQLVAELLALPMNIVVNVHTKDTGGGDDPVITGVKLKGDIKDQIAAEFDFVGLMGVHYEAVGGERVLTRSIKWHPEPHVPILKDRSGRLPKFTPVNFTEQDYTGLLAPLQAYVEELSGGGEVESLEVDSDNDPEPEPPRAGGAVSAPVAPAAKKAAKKAPAKAPAKPPSMEVVERNVPEAPGSTTEQAATPVPAQAVARAVPPAAKPNVPAATPTPEPSVDTPDAGPVNPDTGEVQYVVPAGSPTPEEALANVQEGLGATVVEPEAEPEDASGAAAVGPGSPEPAAEPEQPAAPPAPVTTGAPTCGTPGRDKDTGELATNPVPGCGKDLSTESKDIVNIGFIQTTRKGQATWLCPACIAAWRASA